MAPLNTTFSFPFSTIKIPYTGENQHFHSFIPFADKLLYEGCHNISSNGSVLLISNASTEYCLWEQCYSRLFVSSFFVSLSCLLPPLKTLKKKE